MSDARARAWETRRRRYGPRGNRGTYWRGTAASDAVLQRRLLARLVAVVHAHEMLTEGQIARVLGMDRIAVRELEDDGRESLHEKPIGGSWGERAMRKID